MKIDPLYLDDTHPETKRLLFEHWRGMSAQDKAALVSRASRALYRAQLAGLRLRHPQADEQELELRAAIARNGREMMARLLGEEALPPLAE